MISNDLIVSVILVVYNRATVVESMIQSVCMQTYPHVDFVVIDGGSTDGTVDIIRKYKDKISYWISEPDNGIYDAFNKGLAVAKGDYVVFVGSDDCFYDKDVISNIVNKIDANSDLVSTNVIFLEGKTHLEAIGSHAIFDFCGIKYPWMQMGGLFIKRSMLLKKGIDSSYRIAADMKFILQCVMDKSVKIQYLDDVSIYFSSGGISSNENTEDELIRISKELRLVYRRNSDISVKKIIVDIMKKMRIYDFVRKLIGKGNTHNMHRCNNSWCRWCGRYETDSK